MWVHFSPTLPLDDAFLTITCRSMTRILLYSISTVVPHVMYGCMQQLEGLTIEAHFLLRSIQNEYKLVCPPVLFSCVEAIYSLHFFVISWWMLVYWCNSSQGLTLSNIFFLYNALFVKVIILTIVGWCGVFNGDSRPTNVFTSFYIKF